MAHSLLQTEVVAQFRCTGDACPDTCCKGWGMQLTQETVAIYKARAPELLEAVSSGEAEYIMKRDPATDYCVKFDKGWCGVHARYGEEMLGDACHFFPRATRGLGELRVMSASMSCPEIARLSLSLDNPFALAVSDVERLPYSLKGYLSDEMTQTDALALHQLFVEQAGSADYSAEQSLVRIASVARSLDFQPKAQWAAAAAFYFRTVEGRLPTPEPHAMDMYNSVNALQGLISAAPKSNRPRLMQTLQEMADALAVTLDWDTLVVNATDESLARALAMDAFWRESCATHYAPLLRRWLQAQMSVSMFPFAGLGSTLSERITIIGVRMATVRIALMSACFLAQSVLNEEETVRVMQSLARFMDHLADPTLSLAIYTETGWVREPRLAGLLGV